MYTNPTTDVRYYTPDMILNVHPDVVYLSVGHGRSCVGGHCFKEVYQGTELLSIKLDGNITITCAILKLVAASAAEAELGALFLNV